jgi:ABC-type lipoprotein release transport system permease subunit
MDWTAQTSNRLAPDFAAPSPFSCLILRCGCFDLPALFYLRYLGSELLRRRGRTIVTVLGLALGVALVMVISALTRGLDRAQETTLDPLSTIGTDLTVTRKAEQDGGGVVFGPGGARDLVAANRSVVTDLSKLGEPGERFVHDFFLAGTQLTFPQAQTRQIASVPGVAAVSPGLVLLAQHQEGVVPKIVARIQAGGDRIDVIRRVDPPTAKELAAIQACLEKAQADGPQGAGAAPGGRGGLRGGFERPGLGTVGGGAFLRCMPARFRRLRASIVTPRETLQQVLDPPQTNIETQPYTIAGADQRRPGLALVTPAQVTRGRYLLPSGRREALLATAYAARQGVRVGTTLNLNGTKFEVVGLVEPPLGGQTADVYLPLAQLQKLADLEGTVNVALVRAHDSRAVETVQRDIESTLPDAEVASAEQVADRINGSLVDAATLSRNLGLVLSIVAAAAAFLLAALLTLSSVSKRVRELGTLKALGWRQWLVVRQILGESLAQALVGGAIGIAVGALAAAAVGGYGPTLTATSTTGGSGSLLGIAEITRAATTEVALSAPLTLSVVLLGLGLALLGGLLAGTAGALRAARLRPADALRQLE